VHDALLGAEPAQLRIVRERAVDVAQRRERLLEREAGDERLERADRGDLHVVAAPDREREPVALEPVPGVGPDHHVGGGVVRVRVHGIRPVEVQGRGEADVVRIE
jgi:hypothetical protein